MAKTLKRTKAETAQKFSQDVADTVIVARDADTIITSTDTNPVDTPASDPVDSFVGTEPTVINNEPTKEYPMTLTLKSLDKRGRYGIYTGAAVSIRIPVAAFPNKTAAPTLDVGDGLAEKRVKPVLTPEEQKAARKARPQLTLAEKAQRAEARAAKYRAQLAADEAEAAEQPAEATA